MKRPFTFNRSRFRTRIGYAWALWRYGMTLNAAWRNSGRESPNPIDVFSAITGVRDCDTELIREWLDEEVQE